jgi:hypothetical protein
VRSAPIWSKRVSSEGPVNGSNRDHVFIDPGGVHEGVEKINAIVQLLFTQFEDFRRLALNVPCSFAAAARSPL